MLKTCIKSHFFDTEKDSLSLFCKDFLEHVTTYSYSGYVHKVLTPPLEVGYYASEESGILDVGLSVHEGSIRERTM